jgi:hypothetical protein
MPKTKCHQSYLDKVEIQGIDSAFILRNPALEAILFDRNLMGLKFTKACETASISFLQHFESELRIVKDDLAELMLLSKGLYYWFHNAFANVFQENLQVNFVATQRINVEGKSADIIIPYSNLDVPASALIIGDTVASGATIKAALDLYQRHHSLRQVFLFSIVGSVVGGQSIAAYCKAHDIELTLVYGLAAFGLGKNGFDLSFLHSETITRDEYRERAERMFGGRAVSAAGWDFGSQAQAIQKYRMLCWIEAKQHGLQDSDAFREKLFPSDGRLIRKERFAYLQDGEASETELKYDSATLAPES